MKKILIAVLFLASGWAHAADSVYGDLFPYENYSGSFTAIVDVGKLDRLSMQISYSTPTTPVPLTFTVANVDLLNDTISTTTAVSMATAQQVVLSLAGTTAPSGLTTGTTYFIIKVNDSLIQLATTYASAIAKSPIDITAVAFTTSTWQLIPLAYNAGSAGFSWEASNDGTNWVTVGSTQSLTTIGATVASRLDNFGEFAYRLLRFTFNGPSNGVIKIRAFLNAKTRS